MTIQEQLTVHQRVRFTVDDFLLLARSGAFEKYARTELIEGEILAVNSIHSRHAQMQANLHVLIANALAASRPDLRTYIAPSVKMGDMSMPEPDIVVAPPTSEDYVPLESIALAIEVSDSTLPYDLGRKAALYARNGVPEYWVCDTTGRTIRQMWAPQGETYLERRDMAFGEPIVAATVDGLTVETAGI